jgi:hypothetical protein
MGRKCIAILMMALFACPVNVFADSANMTLMEKTVVVERALYGTDQSGALVDRVGRIEKDMYGTESKGNLATRLGRVYTYMTDNSGAPTFQLKLNGVEWTLTHRTTNRPAVERIGKLSLMMVGNTTAGALDDQLTKLITLAYPGGKVEAISETIPKDTLIKIRLLTPLGTKVNHAGDQINFEVADDVFQDIALVIPQGSVGSGSVLKVKPAENFGRDAKMEIAFDSVIALDGSTVDTVLGEKAKKETASLATAAGVSVAGMILLGPIGLVGGVFVQGQNINIPAGTELFIQTKEDLTVYGIKNK